MKKLTTYILCALIAFLPACQAFTPQQRESGKAAAQQSYENGEITAAQRDTIIAALEKGQVDWSAWANFGMNAVLSALLGVPIAVSVVNKKRGPTEAQRQAMRAKPA